MSKETKRDLIVGLDIGTAKVMVVVAEVLPGGEVLVHDASFNVDDLNDRYDLDLPEGDWDSLGGLVFSELGRVPVVGDLVEVDGYSLEVQSVDGRRVGRVRIVAVTVDDKAAADRKSVV